MDKCAVSVLDVATVAALLAGGDTGTTAVIVSVISPFDEYKLALILLQDMVERKKYAEFVGLSLQEKLFIKQLKTKFDSVLLEVDFNLNVLWRKSGCVTPALLSANVSSNHTHVVCN